MDYISVATGRLLQETTSKNKKSCMIVKYEKNYSIIDKEILANLAIEIRYSKYIKNKKEKKYQINKTIRKINEHFDEGEKFIKDFYTFLPSSYFTEDMILDFFTEGAKRSYMTNLNLSAFRQINLASKMKSSGENQEADHIKLVEEYIDAFRQDMSRTSRKIPF